MESLVDNDKHFIERFLNAFKILGGNELGSIEQEHFKKALKLNYVAESKDIIDLINVEHHVKDGKLDFMRLCHSIMSTKLIFNQAFQKEKERVPKNNTHNVTKNKASNSSQNKKIHEDSASEKHFEKRLRGLLFNINGEKLGYRYQLKLLENANVEIIVKSISSTGEYQPNIPIEILVLEENRKIETFVTSSYFEDNDHCVVKCKFKRGKYILVPILLKWNAIGKCNSFDSLNLESLIHVEGESANALTPACEAALRTVFDSIDLDGNGLLSLTEFDYFILHASGESAADEWSAIADNFEMQDHQLTFEGFLKLYRMNLKADPSDGMKCLQQMGMNESLEMENAQPFHIIVKSDSPKLKFDPLPVSSFKEVSEKVLKKVALEQGSSKKIKNMNDLLLFTHQLQQRATIVVQNQSHSKVTINLDCSKSTNCESHHENLDFALEVLPRTSMIGHHLFPRDVTQEWSIECSESLT